MGSNQSSTVKQAIELLNKSLLSVIKTNSTNTSSYKNLSNIITLNFGTIENCNVNIVQNINATDTIKSLAQYNDTQSIKTLMTSALDQTVEALQKAQNSFLATAFNNQETDFEIKDTLNNIIDNSITDNNISTILSTIDTLNKGEINVKKYICTGNQTLTYTADTFVKSFADNVMSVMENLLMNNEQIQSAVTKLKQEQESKNTGIGEALAKILSSMWGLLLIIPIVIIAIVLLWKMVGGKSGKVMKK